MDLPAAVRRYYAALNAVDLDAVAAMYAEDAEYRSAGLGAVAGRPAILAAMRAYFAEHPDQVAVAEGSTATGPLTVETRWSLVATARSTGATLRRQGRERIVFDESGLISRIDVDG